MAPRADLATRLRAWTHDRQLLAHAAKTPMEALRAVVGVYSSQPSAPLSLLARTRKLTTEQFRTLEEKREVIRLPAMRGSIHLLPWDDAPFIYAATSVPFEKHLTRLEYAGVTLPEYRKLVPRLLDAMQEPRTAEELQEAVPIAGKLMVLVRMMSLEGLAVRVGTSLRSDRFSYASTEKFFGGQIEARDRTTSLVWLAERYLRGYGPARVKDFAWWAMLSQRDGKATLAALDTVDVGDGYLLTPDLADAFEKRRAMDDSIVDLIPKWDSYTMGLAPDGRQRFLDDGNLATAYSKAGTGGAGGTSGDGLPLVLRGGRAVGTWSHRFDRDRMSAEIALFPKERLAAAAMKRELDAIGDLLGADEVKLTA